MTRTRTVLLVTLGILLGAFLAPTGYAAAKDAATAVFVTNTAENPVRVAGSVAVEGTVPVTGNVGVTGSVGITGPVEVTDNREPFEVRVDISVANGGSAGSGSFVVPAGKRLVVEFISARVVVVNGQTPLLSANAGGGALGFAIPVELQGVGNGNAFYGGSMTTLDFAGSGHYFLELERQNPGGGLLSGSGSAYVYLSGYLVPA